MSLSIMLGITTFIPPAGRTHTYKHQDMDDLRRKAARVAKEPMKGTIPRSAEIRSDILKFMFSGKEFFVGDISDNVDASRSAINRALNEMYVNGKLSRRAVGHNKHLYRLAGGNK